MGSLHKCYGNISKGGSVQHGVSLNGASSVSPLDYYLPPYRENETLLSLPPMLLIHIDGAYDSQSTWVGKPRGVRTFLPFHDKGNVSNCCQGIHSNIGWALISDVVHALFWCLPACGQSTS